MRMKPCMVILLIIASLAQVLQTRHASAQDACAARACEAIERESPGRADSETAEGDRSCSAAGACGACCSSLSPYLIEVLGSASMIAPSGGFQQISGKQPQQIELTVPTRPPISRFA